MFEDIVKDPKLSLSGPSNTPSCFIVLHPHVSLSSLLNPECIKTRKEQALAVGRRPAASAPEGNPYTPHTQQEGRLIQGHDYFKSSSVFV